MTNARIDLRVLREGPNAEPKPVTVPSRWTASGKPIPFPSGQVSRSAAHTTAAERGRAAVAAPAPRRARSLLARVFGRRAS